MPSKSVNQVNKSIRYYNEQPLDAAYTSPYGYINWSRPHKGARVCNCNQVKFNQQVFPYTGPNSDGALLNNWFSGIGPILHGFGSCSQPDIVSIMRSQNNVQLSGFNAINFILELDDIPRLFSRVRSISDLILRHNLGFEPLLADLKSILLESKRLSRMIAAIDYSGTSVTKPIKAFRNSDFSHTGPGYTPDYSLQVKGKVIRCIGGNLTMNHPLPAKFNQLRKLLDVIGIYPDASTLWNAIPFSFLVDYLVDFGNILEDLRSPWYSTTFVLNDGYSWTKETGYFQHFWEPPHRGPFLDAKGNYTLFSRFAIPNGAYSVSSESLRLKTPTIKQGLNIAALLT